MAYSVNEQGLYDHLRATLPRFLFQKSTAPEELWGAYVKLFDRVRQEMDTWVSYTKILTATGIWLTQHARDRDTNRQEDETDAQLRIRLRAILDVLTKPALDDIIDSILTTGTHVIVELRRDRIYLGDKDQTGTGDSFAKSGSDVTLTDAAGQFGTGWTGKSITITGATTPGNNGTFTITAHTATTLTWVNASGAAEAFTGTWRVPGFARCYLSRGDRIGSGSAFIVILPFGTPAAEADAIREAIRKYKAAGVFFSVEVRAVP